MIVIYILFQIASAQEILEIMEDFTDYSLIEGTNSICSTQTYESTALEDHSSLKYLLNTPQSHYRISITFTLYSQKFKEMFFQINSNIKDYQLFNLNKVQYCNSEYATLQYMELQFKITNPADTTIFSIHSDIENNFAISYLKIYIFHCSSNCFSCNNFYICNSCRPNFELVRYVSCICPYDKPFQYNDQCLAQCPSGYYGFQNKCHQYISLESLSSDDSDRQFMIINDYNTTSKNYKFYNDSQMFFGPLIQNEAILYKLSQPIYQVSNIVIDFEVLFLDCNIKQLLSFYLDDTLFDEILIEQNQQVVASNLVSFQKCFLIGYERCFQTRVIYLIKEIQQLATIKLKGNLPIHNQKMKWALSFIRVYKIELPVPICLKKQYLSQCVDKCPITSKTIGNLCQSITEQYKFSTILAIKYSDYNQIIKFPSDILLSDSTLDDDFLQFYNDSYLFGGYKKWKNEQQILKFNSPSHFKIKVCFKIILIDPFDSHDNFQVIFSNSNFIFSSSHPAAQCFNSLGSNGCNQYDQIGTEADDYLISFEEEVYHSDENFILRLSCNSLSQESQFYCALYDFIVVSIDCPLNCQICTSSNDCLQLSKFSDSDTKQNSIYYECREQGYYKYNGQCEKCQSYCEVCTSSVDCIKCKDNYKMVGRECICLYNNVISYLTKCNNICHGSCSLCQFNFKIYSQQMSNNKLCAACYAEEHKVLNMNLCICMDGYFMNYITQPYSCLPCNPICLTCNGEQNNCLTCYLDQNREHNNNSCNCIQGYYEKDNEPICQQCDSKCKTCLIEADFCTSCYIEKFRVLNDNNTCLCQPGFYEDDDKNCQRCNSRCETCSNNSSCMTCDEYLNRILQKQMCICFEGYYENNLYQCERCYYSCSRCNNNNNQYQCTQCPSTRVRSQQNGGVFDCICKSGYYEIEDLQCSPCFQLQNPQQTHICYSKCGDNVIQWNEECDDGNQEPRDGCDQCLQPNSSCLDKNCLSCQFKQCIQCNDGYYLNYDYKCLKCSKNCLTCLNSEQNCLECKYKNQLTNICIKCISDYGFYEFGNDCLSICGDGIKTDFEECDDNNTLDGDGCNQYCQIEEGFKCVESCIKIQYLEMLLKENQSDSIYNSQKSIILYFNQYIEIIQVQELQSYIIVEPMQKDLEFKVLDIKVATPSQIQIVIQIQSSYHQPSISVQLTNCTIFKNFSNLKMKDILRSFITLQDYYQQSQLNTATTEHVLNFNISIFYFMIILFLSNSKAPPKFLNEGYTTVFLVNIVSFVVVLMITLFSILTIKLLLYLLLSQTKQFKKFKISKSRKQLHFTIYLIFTALQKIENQFLKLSFNFQNALLRTYMCSAFDLNLAIFLQISNFELKNSFLYISCCLSIVAFLVQIIILNYGIQIINKIRTQSKSQFEYYKFETFFEGVKVQKNSYVAYHNIFIQFKKILFTAFLVNLYYFPCFQIGFISALSLSCSLFLYYKRPVKDKHECLKQVLTETIFWIAQILIGFISFNEFNHWFNYNTLEYIGWAIIILLNIIILLQLFIDIHQHIKYLSSKYQILRKLQAQFRNFFDQQTQNESQFTFESDNSNWQNNKFSEKFKQNNRNQIKNRVLVCFTQNEKL